ncbi:MAG: serine/threonine-protein phosphatase [Bradyrhizobium sp.]|nr:serine/threonine-protein phosphatase [Bradyrhizobium sp.]
MDIATFSATARILGGDTLDIAQRGTHLAVLVGDVSGKGSPAALAAAVLAGLLDDCPTRFDSPARTLEYLNARLLNRLPPEMFVTALYLILDAATGKLLWANAGHERPFLLRAGEPGARTAEELGSDHGADLPLTLDAHSAYRDRETLLRPGDGLFCYTDGLTDLRLATGKRFGIDPLRDRCRPALAGKRGRTDTVRGAHWYNPRDRSLKKGLLCVYPAPSFCPLPPRHSL